jgi:hypothetical protein
MEPPDTQRGRNAKLRNSRKWLTSIAVLGSLLFAGSTALTAQAAAPADSVPTAGASYHICLQHAPSLCLETNGPGNQLTISSSDQATFRVIRSGSKGVQFENRNGYCLRAGTGHVVKLETIACDSTDNADWWQESPNLLESFMYLDLMKVDGAVNGNRVWQDTNHPGDWINWVYVTQ